MTLEKFPKVPYPNDATRLLGDPHNDDPCIQVQEKLDGANFRFGLVNGDLVFGSRNTVGEALNTDQFAPVIEYVRENINEDELMTGCTYFGEAMLPHEIDYGDIPMFVGFEVFDSDPMGSQSPWQSYSRLGAAVEFMALGLPALRTRMRIPVSQFSDWHSNLLAGDLTDKAYRSDWGDSGAKLEGYVFRNPATETIAKFVREDFKESARSVSDQQATFTQEMAHKYVRPARIRKNARKLRDEHGHKIEMKLMRHLPEKVIRDFADEQAGNLFMQESDELDLGEFRSEVSGLCADELNRMVQRVGQ